MQLKDFNLEDFKKGAKCVYELVERCFEGTRTTYVPVFYYGEIDNVNAPIVVRCIGAKGYEYVAQTNDDGYLNTGDAELDFQLKLVEDSEENTQQNHCEYCGGAPVKNDHSDIDREEFIIYQNEGNLEVYLESNETRESLVGTFKINYCPMCGRKL